MADLRMDAFDDRLTGLMAAYADRAVTAYDAAAIARAATARGRRQSYRFGRALEVGRGTKLLLLAAAVALVALAAALVAGSRPALPIGDAFASPQRLLWSPDGANLAFVVEVANHDASGSTAATPTGSAPSAAPMRPWHDELWVVGGDHGEPRKLMTFDSMAAPQGLAWTHDGRALVLGQASSASDGDGRIVEVSLDGASRTVAATPGFVPVVQDLSPVDERLAYSGGSAGPDLFVLNLANGSTTRLTTSHSATFDAWSPDGQWILYEDGGFNGTQSAATTTRVVSVDGSIAHRLGACCGVGWSADSTRAYFQADAGLESTRVDGTGHRTEAPGSAGAGVTYRYASTSRGSLIWADTASGIQLLQPDGTLLQLTHGSSGEPIWTSDGRTAAFEAYGEGGGRVEVVSASGETPRPVIAEAVDPHVVSWRPGSGPPELTFVRDRAIMAVRADGTGLREIVARSTIAGPPPGRGDPVDPARIVLGPAGPDRDVLHVTGAFSEVTVENRSDDTWVPWNIAEKDSWCLLVSGSRGPDPCTVAPHSTVKFTEPHVPGEVLEVRFAHLGDEWTTGIPVLIDFEAAP